MVQRLPQRKHRVYVTIAVYCRTRTKHTKRLCGKNPNAAGTYNYHYGLQGTTRTLTDVSRCFDTSCEIRPCYPFTESRRSTIFIGLYPAKVLC